jgi:hypothetical protein
LGLLALLALAAPNSNKYQEEATNQQPKSQPTPSPIEPIGIFHQILLKIYF